MTTGRALVLGGGGLAGIAWLTGLVYGMHDAGLEVDDADLLVGTSAGSTVAVQLAGGEPPGFWYRRQVEPALQNAELRPTGMSVGDLWEAMLRLLEEFPDPVARRRRIGALALEADTVPEQTRRDVVAGRLGGRGWPARRLALVAVDATTGDRRVFDADAGVDLVDAVTASCAVPGIWPPVTIGDSRFVDGGVYSLTNADLAVGFGRVLVLAPATDAELETQVELANRSGRAQVVSPDRDSMAAFGTDPLDPAVMIPAARAGYAQGGRVAGDLTEFWVR
jgi:NTE family protein